MVLMSMPKTTLYASFFLSFDLPLLLCFNFGWLSSLGQDTASPGCVAFSYRHHPLALGNVHQPLPKTNALSLPVASRGCTADRFKFPFFTTGKRELTWKTKMATSPKILPETRTSKTCCQMTLVCEKIPCLPTKTNSNVLLQYDTVCYWHYFCNTLRF